MVQETICSNCGASLTAKASYCQQCGAIPEKRRQQRICLKCGAAVAAKAETCLMCNQVLSTIPQPPQSTSTSWAGFIAGIMIVMAILLGALQLGFIRAASITDTTNNAARPNIVRPTLTDIATQQPTATTTATPSPTQTPTVALTLAATPTPIIHAVRRGETLLFIADKYKTTVDEITRANNIRERALLSIGQALIIPSDGAIPGTIMADGRPVITYTVQAGDTLSTIAFRYDVELASVLQANPNVDLNLLSIGQQITIPLGQPVFTIPPSPTPTFTLAPPYRPPILLLPRNDTVIEEAAPQLQWATTAILPANVYYVIFVRDEHEQTTTYWTQTGSYRLPLEARPQSLTTYHWQVVVMENTGITENGHFQGNALSNASETYRFQWR